MRLEEKGSQTHHFRTSRDPNAVRQKKRNISMKYKSTDQFFEKISRASQTIKKDVNPVQKLRGRYVLTEAQAFHYDIR